VRDKTLFSHHSIEVFLSKMTLFVKSFGCAALYSKDGENLVKKTYKFILANLYSLG